MNVPLGRDRDGVFDVGWAYLLDVIEFSISYSAVGVITLVGARQWSVADVVVWLACLSISYLNERKVLPTSAIYMISQLYMANRIAALIPVSDEEMEVKCAVALHHGIPPYPCVPVQVGALVVHVVIYIAIVSLLVDLLIDWPSQTPAWQGFWGGVSPFTMLYTSGKCLSKLATLRHVSVVLCTAYIVVHVLFAKDKEPRILRNLDFVANRTIIAFLQAQYIGVGILYIILYFLALSCACFVLRSNTFVSSNATLQSFMGVLTLSVARYTTTTLDTPTLSLLVSLSAVTVLSFLGAELEWGGKLACLCVSMSLSSLLHNGFCFGISSQHETLVFYILFLYALQKFRTGWDIDERAESNHVSMVLSHHQAPLGVADVNPKAGAA